MEKQILITLSLPEFESLIRNCIKSELNARPKEEPKGAIQYLSAKETAAMLKISRPTLTKYTRSSLFKAYRIGTAVRYRRDEVEQGVPVVRAVKYSRPEVDF